VAHWLSIIFFFGLLVALGAILELTLKAHWAQIAAALRGDPTAMAQRAAPVPRNPAAPGWRAAA
jgi:hypothetical protein